MSRSIAFGLAIALALAACGPRAGGGPAWPTPQDPEEDGGESLAPHESVATVEDSADDDDDKPTTDDKAAKPAAEKVETPAATAPILPTTPIVEDPPITEEIVIEIEE